MWGTFDIWNGQAHSNNSSATANKLFECVWLFCGVGAYRVNWAEIYPTETPILKELGILKENLEFALFKLQLQSTLKKFVPEHLWKIIWIIYQK